jgi:hypothetical protein
MPSQKQLEVEEKYQIKNIAKNMMKPNKNNSRSVMNLLQHKRSSSCDNKKDKIEYFNNI